MIPFYLLFIIPLLVYIYMTHSKNSENANKVTIGCFFLCYFFLLALRHETVGNDTQTYLYYFKSYAETDILELLAKTNEPGYIILNKMILLFTRDPQIFLAVTSFLTVYPVYRLYRREIEYSWITIVIFCISTNFIMFFSGIRQSLAIALGAVAFKFVKERKWIKFLLIVLLAMSFHNSAFMLLFMYPLYHYRLKKKSLWLITPIFSFILIFNRQIFSILTILLPIRFGENLSIIQNGAYTMIVLYIIFVAYSFFVPEERELDEETLGIRNFLLMALLLQLFAPIYNIAMRMGYYYLLFVPLLIPKIIPHAKENWLNVVEISKIIMVGFFTFYFFYSVHTTSGLNVYDYHFFWEEIGI